jgi:hypothetical protein
MVTTVAQMTADELREMIGAVVEQKLIELLGDPDEGLAMTKTLQNRLMRQSKAVSEGERGELFEDVVKRLELS